MRSSFIRLALAIGAAAGLSSTAHASLLINISDLTGTVTVNSCDTALAQSATNCVGYVGYALGANSVQFSGTVGDFIFASTTFSSNAPGTSGPFGSAFGTSTNLFISSAAAAQTLKIDFTAFGFTRPAGAIKHLTGTSSQNGDASGGATQSYGFYIDGTNSGQQNTGVTCGPVPLVSAGGGCSAAADITTVGAIFSLSDVATYFVAVSGGNFQTSSTVTATTVATVPEPPSVALVSLALLGAGIFSRRRKGERVE